MKLYDFAFSPNSRKVRAIAYELGIPLEHVHVNLVKGDQRLPPFLAVNPNGRVPVLEDDGFILWESMAIMRYLVEKKADSALVPRSPRARADVDRWLSWQLAHLGPAMTKVAFERLVKKLTGQGEPDQAIIDAATADFRTLSALFDRALDGKEYVAGALSIADFALASHYSLAASCGLDVTPYTHVNAWLARVLSRESMKRALADAHASMGAHERAA